jgi:hypothetical protein
MKATVFDKQDRQCTYNVTLRILRVTIVAVEMIITYSECISIVLVTQHAMRMRCIVICDMSRLYKIFPHYLIKSRYYKKKILYIQ